MRARELRKNMTKAEKLLWSHLRGKKMEGLRFRRQHPLGSYIADFICLKAKMAKHTSHQIRRDTIAVEQCGLIARVIEYCAFGMRKSSAIWILFSQ